MNKFLQRLLVMIFGPGAIIESGEDPDAWRTGTVESRTGIHLLLGFGSAHEYVGEEITPQVISSVLTSLDWENRFYQLIVVVRPGISMEVGGSLNGIDGLSAMYRNRHKRISAVIVQAPESVAELQNILEDFIEPDAVWEKNYEFNYVEY